MNINPKIIAIVQLTVEDLTDDEAVALFLALSTGAIEPYHLGYEKLKALFVANSTEMHQETIAALKHYLNLRLSSL